MDSIEKYELILEQLRNRIDEIERRYDYERQAVLDKLKSVEKKVSTVEDRAENSEAVIQDLHTMLKAHKLQIEQFAFAIQEIKTTVNDLKDGKKLSQKTREEMIERFSSMDTKISVVENKLDGIPELNNQIQNLASSISDHKHVINILKTLAYLIAGSTIAIIAQNFINFGGGN